ncbi:DUF1508 domain-containing protein [Streptomyces sp. NBC_00094]|uniref:DUF1508 domain-containing protein n=1 Tax=Streptomyces sp. NBC_00094 TaxID=2903620 RepID=UPI002256DDF9|nr:DUF1508 domain-containing protein [Streptomyces sp. NBC_00094]MCX5392784.1 YegP family protein [Streptomyces sp. NBC_00094]
MTKDTGVSGTRCLVDLGTDGRYGWRLVAQNGRVVARSGGCHDDHAACRDAFLALCAGHAVMAGGVQHTAGGNGWVWLLRDAEGRIAALSGRSYERHSTCRTAYQRFRALLAAEGQRWTATTVW